jgi:putative Mn2+ efflux pump MntP
MFEGEKTRIFWIGLTILGLASIILFSILWYSLVSTSFYSWNWSYLVPPIGGAVVFILIGLYMMKSGAKKEKEKEKGKIQLLSQ